MLGLAIGGGGAYTWESRALQTEKAAHAQDKQHAAEAQTEAVNAARAEEQRRTAAQSEIAKDANTQRNAALADSFAALAAAGGLRDQVAVLVERARHPAVTAGSTPAGDPIGVLADVLGSIDDRAGELAKIADERGIAGQQCERDYDALTAVQNPMASP
ncbi:DUF2514 family protein [Burkholderia metallica]|nr:DUF2514 family protein [Burkholderia metallica]